MKPLIEYRPSKRKAAKVKDPRHNLSVAKGGANIYGHLVTTTGFTPQKGTVHIITLSAALSPAKQLARIKAQTRERVRKCRARQKAKGTV